MIPRLIPKLIPRMNPQRNWAGGVAEGLPLDAQAHDTLACGVRHI